MLLRESLLYHRFQFSGERHHFLNCFLLARLAVFREGLLVGGSSREAVRSRPLACIVPALCLVQLCML